MRAAVTFTDAAAHHHQRLLALLRRDAYARREVVLASGQRSDFYVDCRRVTLSAEGHFLCGWLLCHAIRQLCPEVGGLGGMSLGADPLVSGAALVSFLSGGPPLAGFYVRKQAKAHGAGQQVERAATLPDGAAVAIVEDVVTTGGSLLRAVAAARTAGLRPVQALALVDRLEGGRERVEQELPLWTFFSREDFA